MIKLLTAVDGSRHAKHAVEAAARLARACGGAAAQELVRSATPHGVDPIVMGTRGMNALGGRLPGSVAQRVVHLAPVPVLPVR